MQEDFHYYATYCAAYLAGYSHEESLEVCYASQFVDCCTETLIKKLRGPKLASTTQSQAELLDARTDIIGIQKITRIWSAFHFLPRDLYVKLPRHSKLYKDKYRLICGPGGALVADTVQLAKGKGTVAAGIAMHVLADTWAHSYFAGTPSQVINNTNYHFYEILKNDDGITERKIHFRHNPTAPDDLQKGLYTSSIHQENENSIMNLGHGRAGHFPDYSFATYKYLPAWGGYEEIEKDNPSDYYNAFCQMIWAMKYLRGETENFTTSEYDIDAVLKWENQIKQIIAKRQLDSSQDWKKLGETLSGSEIEPFDIARYQTEYKNADASHKADTYLGRFFDAAIAQKSMVTSRIFHSGNLLAGFSRDYIRGGRR